MVSKASLLAPRVEGDRDEMAEQGRRDCVAACCCRLTMPLCLSTLDDDGGGQDRNEEQSRVDEIRHSGLRGGR